MFDFDACNLSIYPNCSFVFKYAQASLHKQSLEHAQQFNWSKSARRLLHILEEQIQN